MDKELLDSLINVISEHLEKYRSVVEVEKGLKKIKKQIESLTDSNNEENLIYLDDLSIEKQQELANIYQITLTELKKEFTSSIGEITIFE